MSARGLFNTGSWTICCVGGRMGSGGGTLRVRDASWLNVDGIGFVPGKDTRNAPLPPKGP
ncbi:MAG: hypothetical protein HY320_16585 [Armatimonadetes bacterium]|nr:hypothetical protein [Armatimonadota bacterium]